MHEGYLSHLRYVVDQIRADGFYKTERVIRSPQSAEIQLADGREVLNFCANNYLGLADDTRLVAAAKEGLEAHGFGMASVRYIEALLYQVKPTDLGILVIPSLTILATAALAALPAVIRAVRIDPVQMLRSE